MLSFAHAVHMNILEILGVELDSEGTLLLLFGTRKT